MNDHEKALVEEGEKLIATLTELRKALKDLTAAQFELANNMRTCVDTIINISR